MPIEFKRNVARFLDSVRVDEAETLLEWLQKKPNGKIDLADCSHMHPANLQVLLAAQAIVSVWPKDLDFCALLQTSLQPKQGT